jgi:hypothetical protein
MACLTRHELLKHVRSGSAARKRKLAAIPLETYAAGEQLAWRQDITGRSLRLQSSFRIVPIPRCLVKTALLLSPNRSARDHLDIF